MKFIHPANAGCKQLSLSHTNACWLDGWLIALKQAVIISTKTCPSRWLQSLKKGQLVLSSTEKLQQQRKLMITVHFEKRGRI